MRPRAGSAATLSCRATSTPRCSRAPWGVLQAHVLDVLERGRAAPAHVVNLGHGVPPETDPEVLTRIVNLVHEASVGAVAV